MQVSCTWWDTHVDSAGQPHVTLTHPLSFHFTNCTEQSKQSCSPISIAFRQSTFSTWSFHILVTCGVWGFFLLSFIAFVFFSIHWRATLVLSPGASGCKQRSPRLGLIVLPVGSCTWYDLGSFHFAVTLPSFHTFFANPCSCIHTLIPSLRLSRYFAFWS